MTDVVREKFREIVAQYGRLICDDPRRCENLLRDHCASHRREVSVLVAALKEGVAADLMSSQGLIPINVLLAKLTKRLRENTALEENYARWAVESCALALGLIAIGEVSSDLALPSGYAPFSSISSQLLLRSQPMDRLDDDAIAKMLVKMNFFDSDRNQRGRGVSHQYQLLARHGKELVIDHTTGLTWQRFASAEALSYTKALQYIRQINAQSFAGCSDWRLPTLEEAMSLMEPEPLSAGYLDPIFDNSQLYIWTPDKKNAGAVWCVNFFIGSCDPRHHDVPHYVRAVRVGESQP